MKPEQVIRRPIVLTEKSTQLREKQNQVVFEVARDANKIEIRDAVEKLFKVKVDDVNTLVMRGKDRRMGRGYAKMQNWKKAIVTLKEGDTIDFFADDERGAKPWESRSTSRRRPARRYYSVSDFKEITKGVEPERKLIEHQTRTGGRNDHGRITRRFRGGGHKQRYRIIDWRRDKIGVPAKVATIEYDPNRTARIALLHYVDGEKRYILAPDGLTVGDTRRLEPQRRHQARQLDAAPAHPARHDDPQRRAEEGQGRADGPLRRLAAQLMAKDGDYAQVRLPSGEVRKVHLDCHATIGQVSNIDHANISHRQGRPLALARAAPAQPRRHHEPGRPPDGRRRRPHVRRPPPVLAVGPALQGAQDAQQQAHRRHDRQAPRPEGLKR